MPIPTCQHIIPAVKIPVITLTLLHPIQATPLQSWTFEQDHTIRIGRSTDNDVVLYSAVVSRHHVELRHNGNTWEIINVGANGTYINGERVDQVVLQDQLIFRLARSGPNLQAHIGAQALAQISAAIKSPPRSQPNRQLPSMDMDDDIPNTLAYPHWLASSKASEPSVTSQPESVSLAEPVAEPVAQPSGLLFSMRTGQPLKVLHTLGPYQVIQSLGQGKTGATQLAWRNGHTVILKTLNPQWVDHPQAQERFHQMAEQLKPLNHPGIPRLLDVLNIEEQLYLVLEMIYGQPLEQSITESQPLAPDQAIAWMLELCDTLAYLHQHSVIHGHITPAHILQRSVANSDKALVLIDFAAVRLLHWKSQPEADTAGYLAPEQRHGEATPMTDLYGLGITIAELLTVTSPQALYRDGTEGFRYYPDAIEALHPPLHALLVKLTHPDPSERYPSADQVAEVLRQMR
jgi:serine/threonine-protein kinase